MASLTAGSELVSIADYLAGEYERDMEFVDGYLEERNGFGWNHSRLVGSIGAWFYERRKEWGVDALPSYWVKTTATRVRMPDLCIVRRSDPVEQVRVTAPLLCIELLEPEDLMDEVMKRLDEFVAMGVENLWLLDPSNRSASTYSRLGLTQLEADRLSVPGTPIYLDVAATFALLEPAL